MGSKMTKEELDKIVEQHQHWIKEDCECWEEMKANLRGANLRWADLRGVNLSEADLRGADLSGANLYDANLSGADLSGANLYGANLRGADLRGANLRWANLYGANLSEANLYDANLSGADLSGANLYGANLRGADLRGANLRWANLYGANLSEADLRGANLYGANLSGANLRGADKFRLGQILTDPMTGYKKTKEGVVITAEIPVGAIVFCINGSKFRTNRAKITDMGGHEVLHSRYDKFFEYRLGQEIEIKDFDLMYNVECASGFHFFSTRKEAEEY